MKYKIFLIIFICIILLVQACSNNNEKPMEAKLFVFSFESKVYCFDIRSDGNIIESLFTGTKNDAMNLIQNKDYSFLNQMDETRNMNISERDKKEIMSLLAKLDRIPPNNENPRFGTDVATIVAVVGDKKYWSSYQNDIKNLHGKTPSKDVYFPELMQFTEKLIELAPIKVDGENRA